MKGGEEMHARCLPKEQPVLTELALSSAFPHSDTLAAVEHSDRFSESDHNAHNALCRSGVHSLFVGQRCIESPMRSLLVHSWRNSFLAVTGRSVAELQWADMSDFQRLE